MKKRILSLLLALVMILGMIPATTLTAFAAAADSVWVGGVKMTSGTYLAVDATATQTTKPSGGYAYYKDGTLTLNNYSYTGIGYFYYENEVTRRAIIYTSNAIQIELVGTNNLTQEKYNNLTGQIYVNTACISGDASVSLTGAGTLNLQNATWGIKCKSYLSIESGNLNVDACEYGVYSWDQEVIINGGSLKIDATECAVLGERGIEINGGSGIFRNTQDDTFRVLHSNGTVTIDPSLVVMASTTAYGKLGEYVAANHNTYKQIVIERAAINNVNVSATFSGTPANATSNTDGITVTSTKWYKKNGSGWTELGASDTIKEGNTYRCEVTVGATSGYTLADGYTVKINGTAATKKSGNTWYRDVTITGISDYVEVNDIALPEAYTNPDFTYDTSDVAPSRKHWEVAKVEWFECDKDGKKLSGALTENDVFQKDTYYRIEVTVVPETNWQFHGSALSFYINGKAAMPLYDCDKAYPDSVTGYVVYNTADIEGTYTLYVYDNSLTGSAKDILIEDGQYLGSNATGATATKPASGGYAYYKDGVLELNGYDNEKAHFYFEELALELYLVGDNTIGAIYDNEWGHASNLEVRQGNLIIDAADGGKLTIASNPLDAYANIKVKHLYFNGGELTSCLANGTYGASMALNNSNLYLVDGYEAYVSDTNDFASATKWDGTTDISDYKCVWIVEEQATVTHTVTFKVDTTTVDTKTVEDGKTVTAPADPTQSGKTFLGWYTDGGTKFDFTTPITGDITLTAKFEDATSNVKLGDVNLDGNVDYLDLQRLYQHLSTSNALTGEALAVANVNGDTTVDYFDLQRLYQHLSTDNKLF